MSVCVAVTNSREGLAALEAAGGEAAQLAVPLLAVNLTGTALDTSFLPEEVSYEELVPSTTGRDLDEVEQVLQILEDRPEVTRLVVGVRKRSAIGKAVLGSIAQRLILDASVPVLCVQVNAS